MSIVQKRKTATGYLISHGLNNTSLLNQMKNHSVLSVIRLMELPKNII